MVGTIAQLVEQRTENPCVAGSIPAGTTKKPSIWKAFYFIYIQNPYWSCFDMLNPTERPVYDPSLL